MRGFFANDVDHVVDRDSSQQLARGIDHGGRHQVTVLEQARHFVGIRVRGDARRSRIEDVADGLLRIFREQAGERDSPEILVIAIDHEQPVSLVGQLATHAQVTQYDLHRDVGAHAHGVRVHESAGRVRLVGQHGVEPLAILGVHGFHQLGADGLRQVSDQVREVIELHVFGGRQQLVRVHALDHRLAHVFAELDQYVAFHFRLDEVPDHFPLRRGQRLDQVCDLRRVHGGHHARRAAPRTLTQRATQRREPAFFLGCAGRFHDAREFSRRKPMDAVAPTAISVVARSAWKSAPGNPD